MKRILVATILVAGVFSSQAMNVPGLQSVKDAAGWGKGKVNAFRHLYSGNKYAGAFEAYLRGVVEVGGGALLADMILCRAETMLKSKNGNSGSLLNSSSEKCSWRPSLTQEQTDLVRLCAITSGARLGTLVSSKVIDEKDQKDHSLAYNMGVATPFVLAIAYFLPR